MEEEFYIKVLESVKEYMQDSINNGYNKFVYNDLGWDEKCVDVISAIDMLIEKNKELDKIKFIITDKLPLDMKYVFYCNTDFERLFGNDYISKDKIKEKADDYESKGYIEIAGAMRELLEERN